MEIKNLTPFPAIAWESVDANQCTYITGLIRVKYVFQKKDRVNQWELRLTPDQGELFAGDIYYHDDLNLPVRYESDFINYKPNTDIIINGYVKTRKQYPDDRAPCGLLIADSDNTILKKLKLKTYWQAPWNVPEENDTIEEQKQALQGEASAEKCASTDLGFIKRTDKSRLVYAGTYDEHWLDNQHPYPPQDFNYLYNQASAPALMLKGYIPVGAKFILYNLLAPESKDRFHIPELHCFLEHLPVMGRASRSVMNIDTVLIDIESHDPAHWAVYLSYRHFSAAPVAIKEIIMKYLPAELLEQQSGG